MCRDAACHVRIITIPLFRIPSPQPTKKTAPQTESGHICTEKRNRDYFTEFTTASKAFGWFIARSARTLRLISILA